MISPGDEGASATDQEIPPITVYGDFIDRIHVVPVANMSLLMGMGTLTEDKALSVLVPYVDIKLAGKNSDAEREVLFGGVVTYDNAAFVLASLAEGFGQICEQLRQVATSEVKPEKKRLEVVAKYAIDAKRALDKAVEDLQAIHTND